MKLSEINIVIRVLKKELGLSWLPFLIKCQIEKGRIFRQTHWAKETSIESRFAKCLSISTAMYRELLFEKKS